MQKLTETSQRLEHVILFEEMPDGDSVTKQSLSMFIQSAGKLATSCQEKLAGAQARMLAR